MTFSQDGNALVIHHRHEIIRIEPWGRDSARVRAARHRLPRHWVGALDTPPAVDCAIDIGGEEAVLTSGALAVRVKLDRSLANPEPMISFHRAPDGAELLAEKREHPWAPGARVFHGNRAGSYEIHQQFAAHEGEKLFGMGQHTHGQFDVKGLSFDLVQRNGEVCIPFVLSNRGYGFLWNVPAVGRADFARNETRWTAGQSTAIDYWITTGATPADIMSRYADATGHAPDLPAWASGFWQSKLRYRTQEELLGIAREFRRRSLPLSVIVCDYFHWSAMGDYQFDQAEWPDPKAMVDELAAMDVELMVSIWPTVSPFAEDYGRYRDEGLLVASDQGVEVHQMIQDKGAAAPMPVGIYDPTNPRTRSFVWERVDRNYASLGIRTWWLDASEPEINPFSPAQLAYFEGPGAEIANIYPWFNARLFAEGMARSGRGPTVLLSRSAWAGSQRYGVAVWSGDIPATWESLRAQVRAGLNIAIAGIPWWTTDIGGFHGGNAADPEYQELMVRWFEFGLFCPLFRLHGDREPRTPTGHSQTGGPNEPWSFGQASGQIERLIRMRESLRPYIHDQMHVASTTGLPVMRPLFVGYPHDPAAWEADDEYLFGPDLLVAPILHPGARRRHVYVPAGSAWTYAWDEVQRVEGGQAIEVDAPLGTVPLFVREGSDARDKIAFLRKGGQVHPSAREYAGTPAA